MLYAFLDSFPIAWRNLNLLTRNPIFIDRTRNVGIISKEDAIRLRPHWPYAAGFWRRL